MAAPGNEGTTDPSQFDHHVFLANLLSDLENLMYTLIAGEELVGAFTSRIGKETLMELASIAERALLTLDALRKVGDPEEWPDDVPRDDIEAISESVRWLIGLAAAGAAWREHIGWAQYMEWRFRKEQPPAP